MTRITVRVTPRAPRNEVQGWDGDVLRVRVTAPPADGKANDAVTTILARTLHIPRSRIRLVSGASARTKVMEIEGFSHSGLQAALKATV